MEYSPKVTQRIIKRYGNANYLNVPLRPEGLKSVDACIKKFPFHEHVDHTPYVPKNDQHYLLLGKHFGGHLEGKVLDVGSRKNTIQEVLGKPCQMVDKNNRDLPSFDWEREPLPYADGSFDAVVCMDTLEHIEKFYDAFEDLLRVSRTHVIISLPNCWKKIFKAMLHGWGSPASYGIPPERPFDRHRWFFNPEDAEYFMFYQSSVAKYPFEVVDVVYHLPTTTWWHPIRNGILRLFPSDFLKNLFVDTVFFHLRKKGS